MAVIHIEGLAATQKAIAGLEGRDRQNLERRAVRAAGNVFKAALAASAAAHHGGAENVPASFAKVRVRVSASLRRGQATAIVRPKSPLFNIFETGAGGHVIAPRHGVLTGPAGDAGWTNAGRKRPGAFYARGPVHHPGFRARPLLPGVFAAEEPAALTAFENVFFGRNGSVLGSVE